MQHRVSSGLFLAGCASLPFFNDFPHLSFITPSFLDLSFVFYVSACLLLIFESILSVRPVYLNKQAIILFSILCFSVVASFIVNIKLSSTICGIEECGIERMIKTTASDILKFSLLVFFVFFIRKVGVGLVAIYVRLGFYISFTYVLLEICLSVLPHLVGAGRLEIMDNIDVLFHARVNDWGGFRTRGLAFEPGYQGVFLIICLPFLCSDQNVGRRRRNILFWLVSIITTAAPGAILAGALFFLSYNFKSKSARLFKIFAFLISIPIVIVIYITMVSGADLISTTTRFGSWIGSMQGIIEHIVLGVGPGMAGYWLVIFYPDFFFLSPEAGHWESLGVNFLNAPTFSSLLNFLFNYGLFPVVLIIVFLYKAKILENIFGSNIGKCAFFGLMVVSFTITSYQVMGYTLFIAITIVDGWRSLDDFQ